jgi:hypothetical protein
MTGPRPVGRRWTPAEEKQLRDMLEAGMTAAEAVAEAEFADEVWRSLRQSPARGRHCPRSPRHRGPVGRWNSPLTQAGPRMIGQDRPDSIRGFVEGGKGNEPQGGAYFSGTAPENAPLLPFASIRLFPAESSAPPDVETSPIAFPITPELSRRIVTPFPMDRTPIELFVETEFLTVMPIGAPPAELAAKMPS